MNDLTLWIYIVYVVNRIREVFGGITVAIAIAFAVKVLYFIYIDKNGYVKRKTNILIKKKSMSFGKT